jgi:hypothetical protein
MTNVMATTFRRDGMSLGWRAEQDAGGGDEGTAYLAYRHSIAKGNGAALLPQLSESLKKEIVEKMHATAPLSRSAVESWAFVQRVTLHDAASWRSSAGCATPTPPRSSSRRRPAKGRKASGRRGW